MHSFVAKQGLMKNKWIRPLGLSFCESKNVKKKRGEEKKKRKKKKKKKKGMETMVLYGIVIWMAMCLVWKCLYGY